MNNPSPDDNKRKYFSLLWPDGRSRDSDTFTITPQTFNDLDLPRIISELAVIPQHRNEIEAVFKHICLDNHVIEYRLDILDDLLRNPSFVAVIMELLPMLDVFAGRKPVVQADKKNVELYSLTSRLSELEGYIFCVRKFHDTFTSLEHAFTSAGLAALQTYINDIVDDEVYKNLLRELPGILSDIRGVRSFSIGVNLNNDLLPVEATLLSINQKRYTGNKSIFKKLFGSSVDEYEGIAQLHTPPRKHIHWDGKTMFVNPELHGYQVNPTLVPLFRDISVLIKKISIPIVKSLRKFVSIRGDQFAGLKKEFFFYLGAVNLIQRMKEAGLPMCRPVIFEKDEKKCVINESYNMGLALGFPVNSGKTDLKSSVITNDVSFGPDGRIIILTGPNRGGKTTYTQGIGIAQVFAQTGLYVPGTRAEISPVESIYTHFPIEEKVDKGTGRLGDEAKRFYEIVSGVTGYSLLLLNESFSSTNAGESFFIARDIVRILRVLGAHVVYATHLHELGIAAEEINNSIEGKSNVVSMIAVAEKKEANNILRTFKIVKGPPEGSSYAMEIASKYGIGFDQLKELFVRRGILDDTAADGRMETD
ncbi:MAG: hypothetical protein JW881_20585 [Spirochaetales bacterium]|nr:hypothetical protein [Spirochaetales bacterium]